MRHPRAVPIPRHTFVRSMREMPASVRLVLDHNIMLYLDRRMLAHDLLALMRSFAWHSPTLAAHFARYDREQAREHDALEMLSETDMRTLTA
jgi:hypothetical protein